VRKRGDEYGLKLAIYIGKPYNLALSEPSKGIIVFLHENGTEPDFSTGILVSVGTTTNLEVSQTNYKRLRYQKKNKFFFKFSKFLIFYLKFKISVSHTAIALTQSQTKKIYHRTRLNGHSDVSTNIPRINAFLCV